MNFFNHHIGDYRADTSHLTLLEHGVYRQMLDGYYLDETPIPNDMTRLCRKLGARTEEERAAVQTVLHEFFDLDPTDNSFHHKRCDAEIAKFHEFKEAGKRGAAKRWAKDASCPPYGEANGGAIGGATDTLNGGQCQPIPNTQYPIPSKPKARKPAAPAEPAPGFDQFWAAYPRKVAKPEAMKAWARIAPDDELAAKIMDGLAKAKASRDWNKDDGMFIPHPTTWLNQQRWEDVLEVEGATSDDPFAGVL